MGPLHVYATRLPPPGSTLQPLPKLQPFDWVSGGTIYRQVGRRVTTDLGSHYDPVRKRWTFLSFSW